MKAHQLIKLSRNNANLNLKQLYSFDSVLLQIFFQKNFNNFFLKNLEIYFTKLHISCYNILHTYFIFTMTPEAERFNGWAAMLGFVAAVGAYVTTGQIIPGWF